MLDGVHAACITIGIDLSMLHRCKGSLWDSLSLSLTPAARLPPNSFRLLLDSASQCVITRGPLCDACVAKRLLDQKRPSCRSGRCTTLQAETWQLTQQVAVLLLAANDVTPIVAAADTASVLKSSEARPEYSKLSSTRAVLQ